MGNIEELSGYLCGVNMKFKGRRNSNICNLIWLMLDISDELMQRHSKYEGGVSTICAQINTNKFWHHLIYFVRRSSLWCSRSDEDDRDQIKSDENSAK